MIRHWNNFTFTLLCSGGGGGGCLFSQFETIFKIWLYLTMQSFRHCHNASQFVLLIISFVPHVHFLHNWRDLSTNQLYNLLTLFSRCPLIGKVGGGMRQSIRTRWQREKPATSRTGPGVGPNIHFGRSLVRMSAGALAIHCGWGVGSEWCDRPWQQSEYFKYKKIVFNKLWIRYEETKPTNAYTNM